MYRPMRTYPIYYDSPTCYLNSISSPFPSLPAVLRKRIYLEAGLLFNEEIDLNGSRGYDYNWGPDHPFQVSHDLLLTCRTFYTDIFPILYSTNVFYIRYRDKGNLERLRILSPHAIAHLTQLTIHFNESCQDTIACHGFKHPHGLNNGPLEASAHAILDEWQTTASHIVAHMKPSTLKFSLICDSANIETAERVIKPFRTAPKFADFRIRLSLEQNASLQQLASEISMRSMGYRYPSSQLPFRYLDLPLEIRFKILEYTDLVTPLRQVEWSSKNKFYIQYSAPSCGNECGWTDICSPIRYPSCQFRNCWRLDHKSSGCFCQNRHAAFSSICRCWVPPTSLFLVCRELQQNAEAIFYAKNRFVIVPPSFECYEPVRSTPDRLDVSIFLRDFVSPEAMGFLKYLDIVFPPFHDDYLGYDEPAYQDWLQTIDHIGNLANLQMLTLRVSMADIALEPQYLDDYRTRMNIEKKNTILRVYQRVLKPLSKLKEKGLDRFFVDLVLPVAHTPKFQTHTQENPNYFGARMTTLRLWGERMVMGSEYDSEELRTGKPEDAQWTMRPFESVYC